MSTPHYKSQCGRFNKRYVGDRLQILVVWGSAPVSLSPLLSRVRLDRTSVLQQTDGKF